CY
ncbi:hypothetical protein BVZ80_00970B, partial [Haemophilus influenzae]